MLLKWMGTHEVEEGHKHLNNFIVVLMVLNRRYSAFVASVVLLVHIVQE
jgi:hypothetical protein